MTGRRIVSIWFPQLAMERWCKEHPGWDDAGAFALVSEGAHGMVVEAVNAAARAAGARPGQRLTDARAICPALAIELSDRVGDAHCLTRMGHWARRWSPWTAEDGCDGLLLDSTGAAHCFGGEDAMLVEMEEGFGRLGFGCRIALAPTIGAAWALAHYGAATRMNIDRPDLAYALAPLPVECLRIDGSAALLLRRLGLKTVGALADIPEAELARRFRRDPAKIANPLHRLRQALGTAEEAVEPLSPLTRYRATRKVLEPVRYVAILEPVLADLAGDLCRALEAGQRGLRRARFEAFRVDGHIAQLQVETAAPVRAPDHIVRLFADRLAKLDAGFGFDAFELTALWHEAMEAQQGGLEDEPVEGIALPQLLDRLQARLGADCVAMPVPCASHIPERSLARRTGMAILSAKSGLSSRSGLPPESDLSFGLERERPIRLFDRPEPVTVIYATPDGPPRRFRWRRGLHDVAKVEGPERIAPEWWRERSSVRLRDYYKVEDREGRRFWLYRNGVVDDGRGGPPEWFVHGLFV